MFWWSVAFGSPSFPAALAERAEMPCEPPCTTCHATSAGGAGTVVTPFGTAMRGAGLTGGDVETVEPALSALAEHDSDGDGLPDDEALAAGLDPSTGDGLCDGPVYGCFSHTGRRPSWGVLLLILLVRVRRSVA